MKFNTPLPKEILKLGNITVRSYKFDNQVDISKTSTIKELRTKISQSLGLKEDEFVMKKFSHMGQELKIPSETLDKLTNSILSIYIEYGNPLSDGINKSNPDQIKIIAFYCEYDLQRFSIFPYKMTEISSFIFEQTKSIAEIKKHLTSELNKKLKRCLEPQNILVRENVYEKPGKVRKDFKLDILRRADNKEPWFLGREKDMYTRV